MSSFNPDEWKPVHSLLYNNEGDKSKSSFSKILPHGSDPIKQHSSHTCSIGIIDLSYVPELF